MKLTVGSDATHSWELYEFLWLNSALNRATFEARPSIPANRISSPLYRFLRLNIAHLLSYPASFTSLLKVRSSWTILRNWEPLPRSLKLLCLCSLDLVLREIHVYKEDSPGSLNLFILLCSWKLDWSFDSITRHNFIRKGSILFYHFAINTCTECEALSCSMLWLQHLLRWAINLICTRAQ